MSLSFIKSAATSITKDTFNLKQQNYIQPPPMTSTNRNDKNSDIIAATSSQIKVSGSTAIDNKYDARKGVKLFAKVILWYFLSSVYNIYNKKALLQLGDMPWTIATIQMGMGLLIIVPLWVTGLRKHSFDSIKSITQYLRLISVESAFQVMCHTAGVIALGLGSVSFTHIVKAGEPFFTATLSYLILNQSLRLPVIGSLIIIISGVCLSSASEATFSWPCLLAGLASNIFSAARVVRTKYVQIRQQQQLQSQGGSVSQVSQIKPLSPENSYALSTMLSFVMLIPFTLAIEGPRIFHSLQLVSSNQNFCDGYINALIAGVLIYAYNELSFSVLAEVRRPTTHAVANTLRRVAVIVTSVIIFGYKLPAVGVFGAVLSMIGVLLYSICPQQSPSIAVVDKLKGA